MSLRADSKVLNPSTGLTRRLMARWSCSTRLFDCLSYCTPSYVIEYQGSDPKSELTGPFRPGQQGIHRDLPREWSTAHCGKLAWQRGPVAHGAIRRSTVVCVTLRTAAASSTVNSPRSWRSPSR